jgi:L-amino acid N-acyltransferase YncA
VNATASIRAATTADTARVAAIYNDYVAETVITFETEPVGVDAMAERIYKVIAAGLPYLVAEDPLLAEDGRPDAVLGFAYAGPFRERAAYRHSVESTVYLAGGARGRGVGSMLYAELLQRLREIPASASIHAPVHRVYAGIALPNAASVALHEKFGFVQVATFGEVGFKFGTWIDVGFWEFTSSEE